MKPFASLASTLFLLAVTAASASAQVALNGNLSNSTTGPLQTGVVYYTTGNIQIAAGEALTVQPGAIVKFQQGTWLFVHGTLDVQGTAGSHAIFTDMRDDGVGGDTNGDGNASAPGPGWWVSAYFYSESSASSLDYLEVRNAGYVGWSAMEFEIGATASLNHVTIRDCASTALDLFGGNVGVTVSDCSFLNNGVAVDRVPIDAVPNFTNNSASGNTANYMRVTAGTMNSAALSIDPENELNGSLVFADHVNVQNGQTLTLGPGVHLKMGQGLWFYVHGTLLAQGTVGTPVVITDLRDDSVDGDTNGDGAASAPGPGWWVSAYFYATSAGSDLDYLELRNAGYSGWSAMNFESTATASLDHVTVRDCQSDGIDLQNNVTGVTVANSSILNSGVAVNRVPIDAVPNFSDNSASGNTGNYMRVTNGSVGPVPITIAPSNVLEGALVFVDHLVIPNGRSLTLAADVNLKMGQGLWVYVHGTLDAQGTSTDPVVITDFRDDSVAGDTNGDGGASAPAAGWWVSAYFYNDASACDLDWLEVRFAGYAGWSAMSFEQNAAVALDHVTVRNAAASGLDLQNNALGVTVSNSTILTSSVAIDRVPIDAVPNFTDNRASGNAGNYMKVGDGTVGLAPIAIAPSNVLNGALVMAADLNVPSGSTLTLAPAVNLKMSQSLWMRVHGTLDVQGTRATPVVITDIRDDSVAGDTNNDGSASAPAPGWWVTSDFFGDATACNVTGLESRYAGYAGWAALVTDVGADVTLDTTRIEHAGAVGFQLSAHTGDAHSLVAFDCGSNGFDLLDGSFALDHATSASNGQNGIHRAVGFAGTVHNSIAWNNPIANYSGFAAGEVFYSDGSPALAGSSGNVDVDPSFENLVAGDLRLALNSPCIDTGDPVDPPDADGSRTDMGAYPNDRYEARAYCTAKSSARGCLAHMQPIGRASLTDGTAFLINALPASNDKSGIFFYGTSGPNSAPFLGGTLCVRGAHHRTPVQSSGGNAPPIDDCSGAFSFDFNAYLRTGKDPALVAGVQVNGQYWYRDPLDLFNIGLSDGIQFAIAP